MSQDYYNPEKSKVYRRTFHERDPNGRTWNDLIAAYRRDHPEYRALSKDYARKSKRVTKLGLKRLLAAWGLPPDAIGGFLRAIRCEDLEQLATCLKEWDRLTAQALRTPDNLFLCLRKAGLSEGKEHQGK